VGVIRNIQRGKLFSPIVRLSYTSNVNRKQVTLNVMMKIKLTAKHLSPKTHAVIVVVSLIVFSIVAAQASRHTLAGLEYSIFNAIYSLPGSVTPVFMIITQLGSVWAVLFFLLFALVGKLNDLALKILVNGTAVYLAVKITKMIILRPRPVSLHDGIIQRDIFESGYGFPSGHTAMATVLALTILPYLPKRYYWTVPVWIIAVAFSRIYLGVHAPLDVIGGFALGLIIVSFQHVISSKKQQKQPTEVL